MGFEHLRIGRIRIRHGQNCTHQEQESGPDEPCGAAGHRRLHHWVRAAEQFLTNFYGLLNFQKP